MEGNFYWHFLPDNGYFTHDLEKLQAKVGQKLTVSGPIMVCMNGLHASKRLLDALFYAPGNVLCLVALGDVVVSRDNKVASNKRTILAMGNVSEMLQREALKLAREAIRNAIDEIPPEIPALLALTIKENSMESRNFRGVEVITKKLANVERDTYSFTEKCTAMHLRRVIGFNGYRAFLSALDLHIHLHPNKQTSIDPVWVNKLDEINKHLEAVALAEIGYVVEG